MVIYKEDIIKVKTKSFYKAQYENIMLNILQLYDIQSCEEYIKIVLNLETKSHYFDIYLRKENAPYYVKHLYQHIVDNSSISLSEEDRLGYIINGPNITKKQINKMTYLHINDYHRMLSQTFEFVYDHLQSIELANKWLKPIYDNIIKDIKK